MNSDNVSSAEILGAEMCVCVCVCVYVCVRVCASTHFVCDACASPHSHSGSNNDDAAKVVREANLKMLSNVVQVCVEGYN